jgi:hypothetical protein
MLRDLMCHSLMSCTLRPPHVDSTRGSCWSNDATILIHKARRSASVVAMRPTFKCFHVKTNRSNHKSSSVPHSPHAAPQRAFHKGILLPQVKSELNRRTKEHIVRYQHAAHSSGQQNTLMPPNNPTERPKEHVCSSLSTIPQHAAEVEWESVAGITAPQRCRRLTRP